MTSAHTDFFSWDLKYTANFLYFTNFVCGEELLPRFVFLRKRLHIEEKLKTLTERAHIRAKKFHRKSFVKSFTYWLYQAYCVLSIVFFKNEKFIFKVHFCFNFTIDVTAQLKPKTIRFYNKCWGIGRIKSSYTAYFLTQNPLHPNIWRRTNKLYGFSPT